MASAKLEKQAQDYIESAVEMYLNGIRDCGYESMTRKEWLAYVVLSLNIDIKSDMRVNGEEYKHLRFLGKKRFEEMAIGYIDTYADIQPYIKED